MDAQSTRPGRVDAEAVARLVGRHARAEHELAGDPDRAVHLAWLSVDGLCRELYAAEGLPGASMGASGRSLREVLVTLVKAGAIPDHIQRHVRVVHALARAPKRVGVARTERIADVRPAMMATDVVMTWFREIYLGEGAVNVRTLNSPTLAPDSPNVPRPQSPDARNAPAPDIVPPRVGPNTSSWNAAKARLPVVADKLARARAEDPSLEAVWDDELVELRAPGDGMHTVGKIVVGVTVLAFAALAVCLAADVLHLVGGPRLF